MVATHKQRLQRKCFAACAIAWTQLDPACPEPPHCGECGSRESAQVAHDAAGVMSSSYDFWMRCCLQLCDAVGDLTGDVCDCYPCEPEFDPFIPDPANPETVNPNNCVNLGVLGGVPPFRWELDPASCGSLTDGIGRTNQFCAGPADCCGALIRVYDSCGNELKMGVRVIGGQWVYQDRKDCVISGPATSLYEIINGIWKIRERVIGWNEGGGSGRCCSACLSYLTSSSTVKCAEWDCLTGDPGGYGCHPTLGCDVASACIDENIRASECVWDVDACEILDPDDCSGDGMCGGFDFPMRYCIDYRNIYKWECP